MTPIHELETFPIGVASLIATHSANSQARPVGDRPSKSINSGHNMPRIATKAPAWFATQVQVPPIPHSPILQSNLLAETCMPLGYLREKAKLTASAMH